jgi:hypothetical protein
LGLGYKELAGLSIKHGGLWGGDMHYTISICWHALRILRRAGMLDPDADKDQ